MALPSGRQQSQGGSQLEALLPHNSCFYLTVEIQITMRLVGEP